MIAESPIIPTAVPATAAAMRTMAIGHGWATDASGAP
jgi:hypothetical protein